MKRALNEKNPDKKKNPDNLATNKLVNNNRAPKERCHSIRPGHIFTGGTKLKKFNLHWS